MRQSVFRPVVVSCNLHFPGCRKKGPHGGGFSFSALILLIGMLVASCATLPEAVDKPVSHVLDPSSASRLAVLSSVLLQRKSEDTSGFVLLDRNDAAYSWRLALFELAEHTIDIQTYLWKGDASGVLLVERMLQAADRGVRVRVLIDDFLVAGGDEAIAALNLHPNIEVRLFNPWQGRSSSMLLRGLEFLTQIEQLNQRMHNKLIVADNRFGIVGGRNVGNEYFGLSNKQNFADLDVLAIGPIAARISASFDLYWNSEWAYPGKALKKNYNPQRLMPRLREGIQQELERQEDLIRPFTQLPLDRQDLIARLPGLITYGESEVVYDEPLVGAEMPPVKLVESLDELPIEATREVLLCTPYFVPGDDFIEYLKQKRAKGIRVVVLTNSLGSNNHSIVHSGYKKHRRRVIEAGAELYEFRHDAALHEFLDTPPVISRAFGLHAKVIVVDRKYCFAGSLNLDPRSIYINTELGLVVQDPVLAGQVARFIDRLIQPANSWRLLLKADNKLVWRAGEEEEYMDPILYPWQRMQSGFFGLFNLDSQL